MTRLIPDTITMGHQLMARADDDTVALKFEDQQWSWRELVAEAAQRSELLSDLRPSSGRPWHIGVLMENTPDYLSLIAGAMLCGATIVGLNHTRRGAALSSDAATADCSVVLTDDAGAALLDHAALNCPAIRLPPVEGHHSHPTLSPAAEEPDTRLLLLFTSGSTGEPKAVNCSTGRWARMCINNPIEFTSDDVAYNAMPLFHGNALMAAWGPCLHAGAAFALRRRFSASGFLADIQRFDATFFNYVGRSLSYILAQPESPSEADNRLRFGFGTEASQRDRDEFTRRYRAPLFESYGSSEGACNIVRTHHTPADSLGAAQVGHHPEIVRPDGSVCAAATFDATGALVNADEAIGEIVARGGATVFEGYYNNPDATAARTRDGDYWTGDLGYRDCDGFFYFAGRTGDWMRVDSENFTAAPIERILLRAPDIVTAAVYGVPDVNSGDQVMATIQLRDDADFESTEFTAFLQAQTDMSPKWWPRYIRVCSQPPVTATMKIDKPALQRDAWHCDDPVYERSVRGITYSPLTAERANAIRAEVDSTISYQRRVRQG